MTNIGSFRPLEHVQELSTESVIPDHTQSVANVPLDAFPADGILEAQKPVLNLGETSPQLPSSPAASGERKQAGAQPPESPASEASPPADLTSGKQRQFQQLMDNKTRIATTSSNVLKSFEDTQRDLIANLK